MSRTLYTIGLLPRTVSRYSRRMAGIGATNPNFAVPDDATVQAQAGSDLQNAAMVLLNALELSVPSMHASDPNVLAFQNAWNADPVSSLVANGKLDVDGGYGPNVQTALNTLVGGIAPTPNLGTTPAAPSGVTTLPTIVVPGQVPSSGGSDLGLILLIGGAAALGIYLLTRKRGGGGHRASKPLVSIKTNPRRRRSTRRAA